MGKKDSTRLGTGGSGVGKSSHRSWESRAWMPLACLVAVTAWAWARRGAVVANVGGPLPLFAFGAETSADLGAWRGAEASGELLHPLYASKRTLRLARSLLHPAEVRQLKDYAAGFTADRRKKDSIDGLPAFEMYLRQQGQDKHEGARLLPSIEERLLPFIRDRFDLPGAHVCSVLLRRYVPLERRGAPMHFDRMAAVTAVATLNGDFEGGLFLQRSDHVSSREYLDGSYGPGDVVFHQYDLNHGVDVLSGTRYSAVFWVTDTVQSCRKKLSPWYTVHAEAGNADAQYALSELYSMGRRGYPQDAKKALQWMKLAAEQGHAEAQWNLGHKYLTGQGVPKRSGPIGVSYLRKSAQQGFAPAQHLLGEACRFGDAEGGPEQALRWYLKAAEQREAVSQFQVALAYQRGSGVAQDAAVAVGWFEKAAEQGSGEAQLELAKAYAAGLGIEQDTAKADAWFKEAALLGFKRPAS